MARDPEQIDRALFDEDPVTLGTLLKLQSSDALILEIEAPQPANG